MKREHPFERTAPPQEERAQWCEEVAVDLRDFLKTVLPDAHTAAEVRPLRGGSIDVELRVRGWWMKHDMYGGGITTYERFTQGQYLLPLITRFDASWKDYSQKHQEKLEQFRKLRESEHELER